MICRVKRLLRANPHNSAILEVVHRHRLSSAHWCGTGGAVDQAIRLSKRKQCARILRCSQVNHLTVAHSAQELAPIANAGQALARQHRVCPGRGAASPIAARMGGNANR